MKHLIVLAIVILSGCTSDRVLVRPQAVNDQTVTYARGASGLQSQSIHNLKLAVIDYSMDEMLIAISVANTSQEPLTFSEQNIEVNRLVSDQLQPAVIVSYEQLAKEVAEQGQSDWAAAGNTAAGIGAGFIPYGGIAYSVGQLIYSVSQNAEGDQQRIDELTFTQLNQNYLRKQTIEPGDSYSGILKISFENELQEGDAIIFRVSAGNDIEEFTFVCHHPEPLPGSDGDDGNLMNP